MHKEMEIEEAQHTMGMHPKKFAMWLFIVAIVMMFAAFTSAYIVRMSEGNWLEIELPSVFWVTSALIILSSVSMQTAYFSARKDNLGLAKTSLIITLLLGLAFLTGQFVSYVRLVDINVYFVGNPAGSFLYLLVFVHAFHLVTGIVFLVIVLYSAFRYRVHSKSMLLVEMCTTYWHFLGALWIYLFIFLQMNR